MHASSFPAILVSLLWVVAVSCPSVAPCCGVGWIALVCSSLSLGVRLASIAIVRARFSLPFLRALLWGVAGSLPQCGSLLPYESNCLLCEVVSTGCWWVWDRASRTLSEFERAQFVSDLCFLFIYVVTSNLLVELVLWRMCCRTVIWLGFLYHLGSEL